MDNGQLGFEAYIEKSDFKKSILEMQNDVKKMTSVTQEESAKTTSSIRGLGGALAGMLAAARLSELPAQILAARGAVEALGLEYKRVAQNKADAETLVAQTLTLSDIPGLDLAGLKSSTKLMSEVSNEVDTLTGRMSTLAEVALGTERPVEELADIMYKTFKDGSLSAGDFGKLVKANVPIVEELAKVLATSTDNAEILIKSGQIGFKEMDAAFQNMVATGGIYSGVMQERAQSVLGLQGQLAGAVRDMINDIGEGNSSVLTGVLEGTIATVRNYEKVVDVLKVIVAAYGTYRAAIMLVTIVQNRAAIGAIANGYIALARGLTTATTAQALFNRVSLANPIVLVATALAALAVGYKVMSDNANEAAESAKKVNEQIDSEKGKVESLIVQIKNENLSRDHRNQKLKELIALSPETLSALSLETINTVKAKDAINDYVEAMKYRIRIQNLQEKFSKTVEDEEKAERGENEVGFLTKVGLAASASMGGTSYEESKLKANKQLNAEAIRAAREEREEIVKTMNAEAERLAARKKGSDDTAKLVKNELWYDQQIAALKEERSKKGTVAERKLLDAKIKLLEKEQRALTGEKDPNAPKKKAEIQQKKFAVQSFSDEIDEKKKMYEMFIRWQDAYGKESAEKQFERLLQSGGSYLEWLEKQISYLESVRDGGYVSSGPLKTGDVLSMDKLLSERSVLKGEKSSIDLFKERLDDLKKTSTSVTDELVGLSKMMSEIDANDTSSGAAERRVLIQKQEIAALQERKKMLAEFLNSVNGSEEQRLAVEKYYQTLRDQLDAEYIDGKNEAYDKSLVHIAENEKQELEDIANATYKASKGYKELQRAIELMNQSDSKGILEKRKQELALAATQGLTSKAYIEALAKYKAAEADHLNESTRIWGSIAGMVGDLGTELQKYGGTIGAIGGSLKGLSSATGQFVSTWNNLKSFENSEGGMNMSGWVAAAQAVLQMVNIIIAANRKRREDEKKFAQERINFETEYSLSLIRTNREDFGDNPFYENYDMKIKKGVEAFSEAQKKYEEQLDKLAAEGKSKKNQKNVIDGDSFWKSVGTGASAGAIIGGVAGVGLFSLPGAIIGAIIGGAAGAIAGIFAKKKKDIFGLLMEEYPEIIEKTAEGYMALNVEMAQAMINSNQVDDKTKEMLKNAIALHEEMEAAREQVRGTIFDLTEDVGSKLKNAFIEAFRSGEDAAKAMRNTIGQIIGDVVYKLAFSRIIGPLLDKFMAEAEASLLNDGGDGTIIDDLDRLGVALGPAAGTLQEIVEGLQREMSKLGYDNIFGQGTAANDPRKGTIAGMSQETASVLVGQFNAIRIHQVELVGLSRVSVDFLNRIATNTEYNRNLGYLLEMRNLLSDIKQLQNTRGMGT